MENRSHLPDALRRIVIMGNGGAGKTWLAKRLAAHIGIETVHLDDVYWQPGRYGIAREKSVVIQEVRQRADDDAWLMEGVYGWLVDVLLPRATQLIWLDLCEEECVSNIRARGIQGGESEESFEGLVRWVSEYRARKNNWNSFDGHLKLFDSYGCVKHRLKSREEIAAYLTQMPGREITRRKKQAGGLLSDET